MDGVNTENAAPSPVLLKALEQQGPGQERPDFKWKDGVGTPPHVPLSTTKAKTNQAAP